MKAKNFQIFIQTFEETEYEDSMALKENIEWLKEVRNLQVAPVNRRTWQEF